MKIHQRVASIMLILFLLVQTLVAQTGTRFVNADGFQILGRLFPGKTVYTRMPDSLKPALRAAVWQLSTNPAGMAVYFESNSKQLKARWKTGTSVVFSHVPPTLVKGLDLYALDGDKWYNAGIGNPIKASNQEWTMCKDLDGSMLQYLLYLPDYEVMDSLQIGIDSNAVIQSPAVDHFSAKLPIVVYGTSIVQGAAASRPGMAYPAQLERMLQRETINLGFSGNGQMDSIIAVAMASMDASCYVLDAGPNMSPELAEKRTAPFIRILKSRRPATPVLLVENILYPTVRFNKITAAKVAGTNAAFRNAFAQLQKEKIQGLYYLAADHLIGDDGEGTVDGVHLTDLGFYRMTLALYRELHKILK